MSSPSASHAAAGATPSQTPAPERFQLGDRIVDLQAGVVIHSDETVERLTSTERKLLKFLAERANQEVSIETLYEEVWGYARNSQSRAIHKTVYRLRPKIEPETEPKYLLTEFNSGLRLRIDRFIAPRGPRSGGTSFTSRKNT